uniref:Uncharacterized protein n=1 Tax=Anguilla anguilla TaxID=7936 RepID=A0A0E9SFH4_ANGAN
MHIFHNSLGYYSRTRPIHFSHDYMHYQINDEIRKWLHCFLNIFNHSVSY